MTNSALHILIMSVYVYCTDDKLPQVER